MSDLWLVCKRESRIAHGYKSHVLEISRRSQLTVFTRFFWVGPRFFARNFGLTAPIDGG